MKERGWSELDFLLITGDAYVDHPSFGIAIIARVLEKQNFRVGIIAQPAWQDLESFRVLGKPRLACLVTGGNIDSMVNHYTAAKKRRHNDAYSPGGEAGLRPDRATIVYSNRVREALPGVPLIIGGIEASLRRFAHYDFWSNTVRRSILIDSQANLLIYGMAEETIVEVAERLKAGERIDQITDVRGTMVPCALESTREGVLEIPGFEEVNRDKAKYTEAFWVQYNQQDPFRGKSLLQANGRKAVLQNPPSLPLSRADMDAIYALPFVGTYYPSYEEKGGVPAIEEVEFSLTSVRGCYGACSFCALTFHQGRIIQSRSQESLLREAEQMTWRPRFKGYIHDVGGPTANFRQPACKKQLKSGACAHRQCLYPEPCENLEIDHEEYLTLLRRLRSLPGVKRVFVRSGIRYDAVLADSKSDFIRELCAHHVSGQLKVAPEHVSDEVLRYMGKPGKPVYETFVQRFQEENKNLGKKQYLVPYLMSSHPGSTLKEAVELAEYVRDMGVNPEQVQDFIPTPGTLSTCMYYTGLDPRTMKKVYVPRSLHEKAMQRALIQYRNPKNYELVKEALHQAHREDLIGYGSKCLIRPGKGASADSAGRDGKLKKTRRSGMKPKGLSEKEGSTGSKQETAERRDTEPKGSERKNSKHREAGHKGTERKLTNREGSKNKDTGLKETGRKEIKFANPNKDAKRTAQGRGAKEFGALSGKAGGSVKSSFKGSAKDNVKGGAKDYVKSNVKVNAKPKPKPKPSGTGRGKR